MRFLTVLLLLSVVKGGFWSDLFADDQPNSQQNQQNQQNPQNQQQNDNEICFKCLWNSLTGGNEAQEQPQQVPQNNPQNGDGTNNGDSDDGWLSGVFENWKNSQNNPQNNPQNDPQQGQMDPNDPRGNQIPQQLPRQQPEQPQQPVSTKTGVGSPCINGASGICQDIEVQSCSSSHLRRKCPGPATVMCCPSGSTTGTTGNNNGNSGGNNVAVSSGAGSCSSYRGLAFPLASGSLRHISVNWGKSRQSGKRCHAGLDIYTSGARSVQAVATGKVTAIRKGWYKCSGGSIDAIYVHHTSGALAGKTINYGEVDPGTYSLSVGSTVRQGDRIGKASRCGMLHFELYNGRKTANERWYPARSVGSGCATTSMSSKPSSLMDPRPIIRCTMPSGAQFRHGIGFLNQDPDSNLFAQDLEEEITDDAEETNGVGLGVGGLVAIVVAVIVVVLIVIAVVVAFVMKKRSNNDNTSSTEMGQPTQPQQAYTMQTPQGTLGQFNCHQCGKQYNYAEDLDQHMSMRH